MTALAVGDWLQAGRRLASSFSRSVYGALVTAVHEDGAVDVSIAVPYEPVQVVENVPLVRPGDPPPEGAHWFCEWAGAGEPEPEAPAEELEPVPDLEPEETIEPEADTEGT